MKKLFGTLLLAGGLVLGGLDGVNADPGIPSPEVTLKGQRAIELIIAQANDMAQGMMMQLQEEGLHTKEDTATLLVLLAIIDFDVKAPFITLVMNDPERFNAYHARIEKSIKAMSDILGPKVEEYIDRKTKVDGQEV